MEINQYIKKEKSLSTASKYIGDYLKQHKSQFANVSAAISAINEILGAFGYLLAENDGTHHRTVYAGQTGNAEISITNKDGDIINNKMILNWKLMDTGLGWKINVRIK